MPIPTTAPPAPAIGFLQEAVRWWDHWLKGGGKWGHGRTPGAGLGPGQPAPIGGFPSPVRAVGWPADRWPGQGGGNLDLAPGLWAGWRPVPNLEPAPWTCARRRTMASWPVNGMGAGGPGGIPRRPACGRRAGPGVRQRDPAGTPGDPWLPGFRGGTRQRQARGDAVRPTVRPGTGWIGAPGQLRGLQPHPRRGPRPGGAPDAWSPGQGYRPFWIVPATGLLPAIGCVYPWPPPSGRCSGPCQRKPP